MSDREKVIKGLECCILHDPDDHCRCAECTYNIHEISNSPCANGLKWDALELLKEQEPRVMTWQEVEAHYTVPFFDDLNEFEDFAQDIKPLYFEYKHEDHWEVHWRGYSSVSKYIHNWLSEYNKTWRCWTDKPTEEQRKVVKWGETD